MMGLMSSLGSYVFVIAHIIVSFAYYLMIRRNAKFQVFSECLFVLLIPVFGLGFMLAMKLFKRYQSGRDEQLDVYHQVKNDRVILGGNMQIGVDTIPLNDALFIEDTREKRALLTNAIKQNVLDNGEILRKALRDPDREVSHYAVSMLTHQIEKTEAQLFYLEKAVQEKPGDVELLIKYRETMKRYLTIDFLDKVSKRQSEERYVALLMMMIDAGIKDQSLYVEAIDFEIKFGRCEKAEKLCRAFAEAFPLAEEQFIAHMSLYWEMKDLAKLQDQMRALKACPIQLTIRSLEIIRFWEQGRKYV